MLWLFRFADSADEQTSPEAYFGEQLLKAGYNYLGNEPMYSGTSGVEFQADIFIGIVYYQRLRHMVSDKYQVRSTGPINQLTHQPIKGRKKGGGIRIGEMERDRFDFSFSCSAGSVARTWLFLVEAVGIVWPYLLPPLLL